MEKKNKLVGQNEERKQIDHRRGNLEKKYY